MDRFVGKYIDVVFKQNKTKLNGILLEANESFIFVQAAKESVAIVPLDNIQYYTVEKFCIKTTNNIINDIEPEREFEPKQNSIDVYVNGCFIIKVLPPPAMDISYFSSALQDMIWNNEQVQLAMGKTLIKSLDYDVGVAKIITTKAESEKNDLSQPTGQYASSIGVISSFANNGGK